VATKVGPWLRAAQSYLNYGDALTSDGWMPYKDQAGGMWLRKTTDKVGDERWARDQPRPLISLGPCAAKLIARYVTCDLRLATCDRHHMHASFPEMGRRAVVNLLRVIDIAARAGGRSIDTFSFWKL
jgi:hypothetical protein